MTRSRNLIAALLLPLFLPVQLALFVLHYRIGRVRSAREAGDRGAISIELALAIVALVTVAIGVTLALTTLGTKVKNQVNSVPVTP